MRILIRSLSALLFASAIPALLSAQFQEPTSDELKMTSDPKAPGAAAVYLYREEKTDDQASLHSFYERIKVLTEKGLDLATVEIPYEYGKFQVVDIQGRTIHPDGTVVPLKAKPSDLLDFKNAGHQFNRMVFNLPDAQVGSILEYRLKIHYSSEEARSPHWIIQRPYFVRRAHYVFDPYYNTGNTVKNSRGEPMEGLMYSKRLGPVGDVVRDSHNRFTLDLTDIPALPNDDWMPPLNTIEWSVTFYYTYANNADEYWAREGAHWAKNIDHMDAPSGPVRQAIPTSLSNGDSDETKARKLYAAVMKLRNTDFVGNIGTRHPPNQDAASVWQHQAGSSNEIALLYVSLVRAAGLKAWPMEVVDRSVSTFEPTYLSMDQFDSYIAVVQIDGQEVYLDPGEKMCPFGMLRWNHELTTGMRATDKASAVEETPAGTPRSAIVQRTADLTVDEKGNVQGTARLVMSGQEALYWRQLAQVKQTSEFNRLFNESIRTALPEGVQVDFNQFEALDNENADLVATAKITGSLGSVTGKRLILPGLFFEARGIYPFVAQENRQSPVDLHYATMERDETTYHLPASFDLDSKPRDANVSWRDHGTMTIRSSTNDGSITLTRAFVRTSTLLDQGYYDNLRAFYRNMSQADQQQIVLTRPATEN